MEPKYSSKAKDGSLKINHNRYKREIKGLKKDYWAVVFEIGSEEEVATWGLDKFLEARAAVDVLNEDAEKEIKKKKGGR